MTHAEAIDAAALLLVATDAERVPDELARLPWPDRRLVTDVLIAQAEHAAFIAAYAYAVRQGRPAPAPEIAGNAAVRTLRKAIGHTCTPPPVCRLSDGPAATHVAVQRHAFTRELTELEAAPYRTE